MNKKFYFNVFKNLIRADLVVFKDLFKDKAVDAGIWLILTIVVMGYIMPYFGLQGNFGPFQLGGVIASVGLFELYGNVVGLVSDFEGDRTLNYTLTLPIPSWIALASKATYFAIISLLLALVMFPLGKLTLWNQFSLSGVSYVQFFLALNACSIFYGCFTLCAASFISSMTKLGSVWARFIFPMWFMGGFQFSWLSLLSALPFVAYLSLINPMIYITEITRASMLGQTGYINFWICLAAILFFSLVSFMVGIYNLKQRLDYL